MVKARWVRLLAGLFVLSFLVAACSSDDDGGGTTGVTATDGGGGSTITIADFTFDPSTISASGPTEVTITNNDAAAHTFTLDDGSVDEEIEGGETVTVTVDVSQTTGFYCRFHPQMTGTVEVS